MRGAPVRAQAPASTDTWAITGAVLIDGTGAQPLPDSHIVGRGDRIVCAGRAQDCVIPDGTTIVEARGKWAIPGLIDTHVHLVWGSNGVASQDQLVRFALGITTTRDAGTRGQLDATLAARTRASAPEAPEPRIVVSGLAEPKPGETDQAVVAELVRGLAARGVDAIKVKPEYDGTTLQTILRQAHASGLPAWGHTWHVRGGSLLSAALDARIDGVAHMFTFSEYALRADPARPPAPGGLAYWIWVKEAWYYQDEARLREATDRLIRQHVWLEPLLATEKHFTLRFPVPDDIAYLDEERTLEAIVRSWLPVGDSGWIRAWQRRMRLDAVYARMCDVVRRFHEGGGVMVTGSDESPAGVALLEEISLLTGCGLTPMEAIQSATRHAAAALRLPDAGTIEAGKRADLVLLDGDPLADLGTLRRPWRVVKGGHVHDPARLLAPMISEYEERMQETQTVRRAGAGAFLVATVLLVAFFQTRRRRGDDA